MVKCESQPTQWWNHWEIYSAEAINVLYGASSEECTSHILQNYTGMKTPLEILGARPGTIVVKGRAMSEQTTLDPAKEDLWIASIMGPAHLFRAGAYLAVCGRSWISGGWSVNREQPATEDCCSKCDHGQRNWRTAA